MANALTQTDIGTLAVIQTTDIGEIIKPLVQEIFLFDTYVAGTTYVKDQSVFERIKPEDSLCLQRENNKFDSNAILVLTERGEKLGYIPERHNIVFARLMDAGKLLKAQVIDIRHRNGMAEVRIGIYLLDI